jgi:hypothetical protein
MGILTKWLGPASRYQRDIPYTYEARTDALCGKGSSPEVQSYFCDTLCGLLELLQTHNLAPAEVELYAIFQDAKTPLEVEVLCDLAGRWLERPAICRTLEQLYAATGDPRYRGHVEAAVCRYEDRSRRGMGPC